MKALFKQYQPVVRFLLLFFGSYAVLSLFYGLYLHFSSDGKPDPITQWVATQSESVIESFGYASQVVANEGHPSMQLWVEGTLVGRIIEGCNALSIVILFASFIIAFAEGFKKTLLFLFAGAVIIYGVNLLRIAVLAIALYRYPSYQEVLHTVVFPALIYGMVFLLWVLWIRSLNSIKEKNAQIT